MSQSQYNTLTELFNEYPWRTASKFIPLAKKYGFTNEKQVREFLKNKAIHDEKINKPSYLPIFSINKNEFQFDTVFLNKIPFLFAINVNTRKAFAYKMKNKSSSEVIIALDKLLNETNVKSLVSDEDPAYLSTSVLSHLKNKNISYRTTEDNNHNVLGIINRFVRTIRDLSLKNKNLDEQRLSRLIRTYNNTPHKGLNGKAPNEITEVDENEYIKNKLDETNEILDKYDFEIGDRVRIINDKNKIGKNRTNLSMESYLIDSIEGNQFVIKAKDGSIDTYPSYRLRKCDDRYEIAETIKNGKRGIIEKIIDYDEKRDRYKIIFEPGIPARETESRDEGTEQWIPAKNLREGKPLLLSRMEREYWSNKNKIPEKIKRWE